MVRQETSTETNSRIRQFIAAVQIGGGFAGMAMTSSLAMAHGLAWWLRVLIGSGGIPFALCAYAGRALWLNQRRGYVLSMVVQAVQIPAWSSPGALYMFYCGGQVGAWFSWSVLAPMAGIGGHITLDWSQQPRGKAVGLNFLAIWALWHLALGWSAFRKAEAGGSVVVSCLTPSYEEAEPPADRMSDRT